MDTYFSTLLAFGFWCGFTLAAICPPDWYRYGESCYFVVTQQVTWHQANYTCAKSQAQLAVPNSKSEQDFIWKLFLGEFDHLPPVSAWIGCNDIEDEGNWQDCPLKADTDAYENWKEWEPDNELNSDCASLVVGLNGLWADQRCENARFAVCELTINATPVFCLQTGTNGRLDSVCLLNHVMKELIPGKGAVVCEKACRAEPECRSFNLLEKGRLEVVCQLNNASRQEAADGDMMRKENCFFHDL